MIRFVMSDLDGTLVPEGTSVLPQRLVDALNELQRSGIPFAASSGRQHASIRRVFQVLEEEPMIVSLNGGCICKGDDCLYLDPMPQETALAIAKQAGECPGCDVILETKDQCWVYVGRNGILPELDVRGYQYALVSDLAEIEGEVIKVACYLPEKVESFQIQAQERWGGKVKVARSGDKWVDFNVADKGKGLRAACKLLGVDPCDTAAFGDNLNDEAMLAAAGQPFVAPNGNPALLERYPVSESPVADIEKISKKSKKGIAFSESL